MKKYVALLRGINVGKKQIRMADLKACFADELGFQDARTHLASGNVIFGASGFAAAALEKKIGAQLEKTFGFPVEVVIRGQADLQEIARKSPFAGSEDSPEITRYVTFFKNALTAEQVAIVKAIDNPGETHILAGTELYSELDRNQSENLVFSGNFIEKKLKTIATARNWRVVRALAEMVGEA